MEGGTGRTQVVSDHSPRPYDSFDRPFLAAMTTECARTAIHASPAHITPMMFATPRLWCQVRQRYLVERNIPPSHTPPPWKDPADALRIVVLHTDRIGDTLNSIYFLANLGRLYPGGAVHFIGRRFMCASFLSYIMGSQVTAVHAVDSMTAAEFSAIEPHVIFDLNPDAHLSPRYAAYSCVRIGHHRGCDIFVPQMMDNWKANNHLNILRLLGEPVEYTYNPLRNVWTRQWPTPAGPRIRPYVALCLEATASAWTLSPDVAGQLIRFLHGSTDLDIYILGADINAHGYVPSIRSERIRNLTCRLCLSDSIRVLADADFVIAVDTGLMHVASYLGRPLLAIFTCGNPARNGPQGQTGRVAVLNIVVDPPTGRLAKKDHAQSGIERAHLRLDHIVEGLEALRDANETSIRERIVNVGRTEAASRDDGKAN